MAASTVLRPIVPGQKFQRHRHGQEGRDVAGALPLQPPLHHAAAYKTVETRAAIEFAVAAPRVLRARRIMRVSVGFGQLQTAPVCAA